jgi:hypothetical protein
MSSIDAISGVVLPFDAYSYQGALSADALLAYCRSQLDSLDATIQGYLDQQRLNIQRKKALSDVENMMKKYANVPNGEKQWDDYDQTFLGAIGSLPPGDPVRAKLEAKWDELAARQGQFTKEEWTGHTGDIGSILSEVTGNAEINMIHLQSIMSQRQTAVQLTTGMLAKYDEGIKSVIANIGR